MADERRSDMSLVPYTQGESQEIVLRHGSAVVLYDHRSRQISLGRDTSNTTAQSGALARGGACPTCHRPYHDEGFEHRDADADDQHEATFTDPEYFRLLHRSLPASASATQPPTPRQHSPRRRLIASEDTGRAERAEGTGTAQDAAVPPPSGAEFVGSAPAPSETAHGISSTAFSPNYFHNFFVVERELGRGGKGVVYLVKHLLDKVVLGRFACKRVPVGNDHEWLKKVLVEVQLLTSLTHPNLVQYRHVWLEDCQISSFGPSVPCAFILQQYCNAGDLHGYMLDAARAKETRQELKELKERIRRRSKGQLEPPEDLPAPRRMHFDEIFSFFKDITAGLHHLHANGYIHRDLKPSNCLLHRSSAGHLRVLVSDFGEVQAVSATRRNTGSTGTISYCAPEVLRRDATGGFGNFSTKSDIFSLGMIVFFMCFGRLPYKNADEMEEENEDLDQLREEIAAWAGFDDRERQRNDLPERLYRFLRRLLSIDPDERPSTDEILQSIGAGSEFDDFGLVGTAAAHPQPKVFDEIKSRVSNLDSPSPTPQRVSSSNPHHKRRASARLHPVSPTKLSRTSSRTQLEAWEKHGAHVAEGEDSDSEGVDVFADAQQQQQQQQQQGGSVVLRNRSLSSHRHHRHHHHHHHHHHHQQHHHHQDRSPSPSSPSAPPSPSRRLLMPPPAPQQRQRQTWASRLPTSPVNMALLKVSLFVAKLVSLIQPCAPLAPKPWLLYPLLAVAALDFAVGAGERRRWHGRERDDDDNDDDDDDDDDLDRASSQHALKVSVALALLHFAVLGAVARSGRHGLCPAAAANLGGEMDWRVSE